MQTVPQSRGRILAELFKGLMQWLASAMNSSLIFCKKKIKISLWLEPFISTERPFLKHFVQCNMFSNTN